MTHEEAIHRIENHIRIHSKQEPFCACHIQEALKMAINALKAQEPMAVHVTAEINYRKIGNCPNCGKPINSGDYPNYCGRCGQAVKWE